MPPRRYRTVDNPPPQITTPSGRPAWYNPYSGTYTTSRSYGLRMQRGYARGATQSMARRGVSSTGESESARRRRLFEEQYPEQTPWQRFTMQFELRYGFSYNWWRKIQRRDIRYINEMSPYPGSRITPAFISSELAMADATGHDQDWIEQQLSDRRYAMEQYRTARDKVPGQALFRTAGDFAATEWWYYH